MKKIGLFILGLCSLFFAGNFTRASDYEYTNLNITANILNDGTIDVNEDFTANFFVNKHGIIRNIPLNYSVEGKDFHINVSDIYVQGKNFTTSKNNGNIEIKIGDADTTVVGEQSYPISYSAYGLIRNFSGMGYAELYWNLVGYDFDTNINKVRAELILPKTYTGFTADDFLITTDGKSKTIDAFEGSVDWSRGDRIIITYNKGLSAYHGITLAIKFPNNYFTFDHERQINLIGHTGYHISTNSGLNKWNPTRVFLLSFTLFIFIILFKNAKGGNFTLQGKYAKKFPIVIQYEPPKGINSAEAGLLLHRQAKARDMLSLIYKRATEGLINLSSEKINMGLQFTKGGISFNSIDCVVLTKHKDISENAPIYEKKFFNIITQNKTNIIGKMTNLYDKLHLSDLEKYGKNQGWIKSYIKRYKLILYLGIVSLPIFIIGTILGIIDTKIVMIAFILVLLSGLFMSGGKKFEETEKGAKLISHILGYREFLTKCDENKLKLFLKNDPLYFDKTLPYAVVFGLETEFLKKIEPIIKEMNIKFSYFGGNINSMIMINNIISEAANHSSATYNSNDGFNGGSPFGGGFSSGGGGGGGGGSSW